MNELAYSPSALIINTVCPAITQSLQQLSCITSYNQIPDVQPIPNHLGYLHYIWCLTFI